MTILVALSAIASQKNAPTKQTEAAIEHLLDYVDSNPIASVRFHASDMVLQIHSDASYLTEPKARSRVAGRFFLGKNTKPLQPFFSKRQHSHSLWNSEARHFLLHHFREIGSDVTVTSLPGDRK